MSMVYQMRCFNKSNYKVLKELEVMVIASIIQ